MRRNQLPHLYVDFWQPPGWGVRTALPLKYSPVYVYGAYDAAVWLGCLAT